MHSLHIQTGGMATSCWLPSSSMVIPENVERAAFVVDVPQNTQGPCSLGAGGVVMVPMFSRQGQPRRVRRANTGQ
jgi:hypothetical protein